jgi:thiol-activated cytolysin
MSADTADTADTTSTAASAATADTAAALNAYVKALDYDPRVLLATAPSGSVEVLPAKERSPTGKGVILCTNERVSLDKKLDEIVILNPTGGTVFPGAVVRANRNLADGKPDAVTLPRAPITVSIDLPGLAERGMRQVLPTHSALQVGVQEMLALWERDAASTGYVNAGRSFQTVAKAYSSEQMSLDLGFRAEWSSGAVRAKLRVEGNTESSVAMAYFKQVYYTVSIDKPASAAALFADGTTAAELAAAGIDRDNPPAYVASVDYGRIVMIRMESQASHLKADIEGALDQATSGKKVSAELQAKYDKIKQSSTFTAIVLGGNPGTSARIVEPADVSQLRSIIEEGAIYSRSSPGAPVSYVVNFLKDHQQALIGMSTAFNKRECIVWPSGYVKLVHKGAYIAKFQVDWFVRNVHGVDVPGLWVSGEKTAGYSQTVDLDGDARNVRVRAWAKTGLVWDPWGEIVNDLQEGPTNKTYTVGGTTLGRKVDIADPQEPVAAAV